MKREHMIRDVLAHANVPAVVLANVNGKRIRAHNHTCPNITVAEEHPVEEGGARCVTNDHVPSGDLGRVEMRIRRDPRGSAI